MCLSKVILRNCCWIALFLSFLRCENPTQDSKNHSPVFDRSSIILPDSLNEGDTLKIYLSCFDSDGDSLSFSSSNVALKFSHDTALWYPDFNDIGVNDFTIRAQDSRGGTDSINFQLPVIAKFDTILPPLAVGNKWVYLSYQNIDRRVDSSYQMITIDGNKDSVWFISVKDSFFYFRNDLNGGQIDTHPQVSSYCDTCIQSQDSIRCHMLNYYFRCNVVHHSQTRYISIEGEQYLYYEYMFYYMNYLYVKDLGLVKLWIDHQGPGGFIIGNKNLVNFNNVNSFVYQHFK